LTFQYVDYLFRRALQNIVENRFLTMVTVAVITVSMLLFSAFLLVYHNLERSIETWGHDVQVSAYLLDTVTLEEAEVMRAQLLKRPEVIEVTYVSKEEALQSFSASLDGVSGNIDDLGTNPLPASLEIRLKEELGDTHAIETFVSSIVRPEFEDIDWSQDWVEKFYAFLSMLRWSGIGLGALLAAASVFIISQTIKLGFFARRDEFEILELVGATPAFIRIPFLIEGVLQGLTGALMAQAMLYLAYRTLVGAINVGLQEAVGALSVRYLPTSSQVAIALAGMGLGLLGSLLSVRKVVRVGASG